MNHDITIIDGYSVVDSALKTGFEITVTDNINVEDTVNASAGIKASITDGFNISDEAIARKIVSVVIEDNFGLSDQVKTNAQYLEKIVDNFEVNAFITGYKEVNGELELDDYLDCWVVNNETNAFSRYDNFNFNSFAKLGDTYYAANELGLYKLEGKDDDGKDINSKLLTGKMDIGRGTLSYVRKAIIYQKSDGTLNLKIHASDGNIESFRFCHPSEDIISSTVTLSKGRQAVYWQFELTNDEQTNFELDAINIYRVVTGRFS